MPLPPLLNLIKQKRQSIALLTLILLVSSFFLFSFSVSADNGLIQCGRKGSATLCNICDLVLLAQSLINKILSYFVGPIAALMLGYGGFLMVLAGLRGGNASAFTQGKKVLTNTGGGIVLLFVAWLLIDSILKLLGGYQYAAGSTKFGPWNEIECVSAEITLPNEVGCDGDSCKPITGNSVAGCTVGSTRNNCGAGAEHLGCRDGKCEWIPGSAPNGCTEGEDPKCGHKGCDGTSCKYMPGSGPNECDTIGPNEPKCVHGNTDLPYEQNARNAQALDGIIQFTSASPDCNGKSAATNFQELLNSRPLTVCHAGCRTDGLPCTQQCALTPPAACTANPRMIADLKNLGIDRGLSFRVNSIATGQHSSGSDHYQGKALDLLSGGTSYSELETELKALKTDGSPIRLIQCEDVGGNVVPCSSSATRHLHVSYN